MNSHQVRISVGSSSGNSGAIFQTTPPLAPQQNPYWNRDGRDRDLEESYAERRINELRIEALRLGADIDEVDEILKRAFFEAAKGDKNDRWVLDQVRPKIRAMIAKLRHEVEYSSNEDSALMSPEKFTTCVSPNPELYHEWDDAAGDVVSSGLAPIMERVSDLRLDADPRLVVVEAPSKRSMSGCLYEFEDIVEVVACIFAEVQVRFQVRVTQRAKGAGNAYSGVLKRMMEPPTPDDRLKNEFLRF